MVLSAAVALGAGAVGFWLGRQSRSQKVSPARHTASRTPRTEEEAIWTLRAKAEEDDEDAVRIRLVHINDVYIMDNLPRLRKFLDDCCFGIRRENLVVCVGGDLLSPYPLSTLDKGRGMVEVMLESGVQYACFGNHEADVDLRSLKQRLERWRERGGIWINTNMPDLLPELGLPTYASVVGLSKDGDSSRQLCLLGVCTKDPSLYTDDADFGGAISTALDCNECIRDTAKELMDLHKLDPDAQKVDAVVALTHQDLAVDIELATIARSNGIHAVLGGHDHTEYLDQHNGCVLLKTGMDAQRVGVVDLLWQGNKDVPTIDFYDLIPLASFATSRAVSKSVQKHMRKLWNLEQLKARVHLSVFPEQPVMSSKNIRKHQTTLGSFLCSALRDEMQVDCVLFDGGNIRGDRDYIPSTEHYLGSRWVFTLSDLELELPWSSGMVEIVLDGEQVARAVRLSRTLKPGSGGFLQTDEGLWVSPEDQAQVTHIANEQWKKDRKYRVGMMHSSLVGMNHNPVFEEWCKANSSQIPKEDSSRPAKELIKKQLARRVWDQLPEFHDMNTSHSGALSKDEVIQAYRKTFSNSPDAAVEPSVDQLMAVADFGEKGELSPASYQGIFRLPTWVALSYFTAEQEMSSKDACIKQTSMGSFLCDALRSELDVDVVLFDGGNIRGNRDYVPVKGHHRGSKWAFTVTDLRRELPWPSEIAIVSMTGEDINKAVVFSRKHATGRFADFLRVQPPVKTKSGRLASKVAAAGEAMVQEPVPGGFLQTNSRTQVTDQAVTHISGKPIVKSKRYKVALLHAALRGMNGNSIFEIWASTQGNVVPPFEACQPAAEHLTRHFTRLLWLRMPSFQILDVDKSKTISRDELLEGIPKGFPRARDPNIRRSLLRRLLATIELDSTGHITEEQYLKLHTKLKDSDSINFAEGDVFCDWAYWTSPQG